MDFLQRHLPRVYQAVQNALDYLSNAAAQVFGAPANAPRPSNSGSKVAIDTKTPQDASKRPTSASWGAESGCTQGSGELTLEDALEATEWSTGHAEPPSDTQHDDTCRHSPGVTTARTEERDLRHIEGRTRRDLEYQTRDKAKEMPSETHFQTSEPGHRERHQDGTPGDLEPEPTGDTKILLDEAEDLEGRSHMCIQKLSAQMDQMMVEDIGLLKDQVEDIESSGHAGDDGVTGDREAAKTEDAEVLPEKMEKNEVHADEDETRNTMKLTDTGDTEALLDEQKDPEEPAYRCKDGMGFDLEVSYAGATVNLIDTTHWYTEERLEGDLEQVDTRCAEHLIHQSDGAGNSASDHHEGTMDKGDHGHPSSEVTEILLDHLEDLEISTETLIGVNDVDQTKEEGLVDNSTPQIQRGVESPVFNVHLESKEGEETLLSETYPPSPCEEKTLNLDFMSEGKGEMGPSDQEIKDVGECIEESVTEKPEDLLTSENLENKNYTESNIECFVSDPSQSVDKRQERHQDSGKVDLESSQKGSADDLIPPEGQEEDWPGICVSGEEHVPLMDEAENDDLCHLEEQKNQSEIDTCPILDLGEILERFDVNTKSDSFSETLERSFVEEIYPIEQVEETECVHNVDVPVSTSMDAEAVVPGVTSTSLSFLEDSAEIESVLLSEEYLPLSQLHQPHHTTSQESEGNAGQGDEGVLLVEDVESENRTFGDEKPLQTSDKSEYFIEEESNSNYEVEEMNSVSCQVLHLEEPEYSFPESDQTPNMIEVVQHEDRKDIYSSVNVPVGEEQLDEQAENHLRDFERTVWYEQYEESKGEEVFHSLVETNLQHQGGDFHELEGDEKISNSNVRPEEEPSSKSTNSDEILLRDTLNGLETTCRQNSGNTGNDQTNDRIEIKDIQEVHLENLHEDSSLSGTQYSPLEGSQRRASEKDTDFFTQIRSEISDYIEDEQSQQWTGESQSVSEMEVKGPIEQSQTQEDDQREVNITQEEVVDTLLDKEPTAFGLSEKSDLNLSNEMASAIDPDLNMEGMCDTHNELDLLSEIQNFIAPWCPEPTSSKFAELDPEREIQSTTETGQLELEIEQVNEIHISEDIWSPDHSSEDIPKEDVQSPHHSRKDIESSDHPTECIEPTDYSTEDIRPLAHPTEDIGPPEHFVEDFKPPDHSTKDIESLDHTSDDIKSPDHNTDYIKSPEHPTEDIESSEHSTEDTESPDHPTEDIRPPEHHAEYMVSTEHSADDIESSDYHTEDIGSLDLPTDDIVPLDYTTDDIKSPDHPIEDIESSDHSTEDTKSPDHPIEEVVSLHHSTEDIRPPDHPAEYMVSTEHSADDIESSDYRTEDIGSLDLPTENIGPLDYTTDDIKSPDHPVKDIESSDHSTEDTGSPDHPTEDVVSLDHLTKDIRPLNQPAVDIESTEHSAGDIVSLDHPTEDIRPPDHPTEYTVSTEHFADNTGSSDYLTEDIGSLDLPIEDIGLLDYTTTDIKSPGHPVDDIELSDHSTEDIRPLAHPTEDIGPPDHLVEDFEPPDHSTKDTESPDHSTDDIKSPDHTTYDIQSPDHRTEDIESSEHSTEDIGSPDHPTEDIRSPDHPAEDIRSPDHPTEDIRSPGHPAEEVELPCHPAGDIESPEHSTEENETPEHPTVDIVPPDHPKLDTEIPAYPTEDIEPSDLSTEDTELSKHSREDIRSTDHGTEDIGLQNQSREDIAITMFTESNIAASTDDNESLSDASGLHGNINATPEIDIVISVDSSGAELSESQMEPESSHALDVIKEGNEQENKEAPSLEEQIICQIRNKSADKLRGTRETEDELQSTDLPSHGDSSKTMKDHKEHFLRPSEDHLQKDITEDPTQPEGEDEADADWEAHRTLDLSAQKSRVLLRRKTSIRRKQGQRQSLPEPRPAEPPVPAARPFPVALPGLGVKLPIPLPRTHAAPSEPPPPEQRNEERPAHEELAIKPKKVIPKHGFGMPHPQMMQELQSRLLKKKPKE